MRFFSHKAYLAILLAIVVALFSPNKVLGQNDEQKLQDLSKQIEEYTKQISTLQAQANTLANQIAQFNAQIKLTELKITQTQEQILLLGGRIDQLTVSLSKLSEAFSSRAVETYKLARIGGDSALTVLGPHGIEQAVSRYHYLQKIQEADRTLLSRLTSAQNTYKTQKSELEVLQKTLEDQKKQLDNQKNAKSHLLSVTKNDEKKYQQLLAQARAEYEAIQAIIAGRGDETEVGHVNEGQKIASIIQGPSCNSSGQHLHFIVAQKGTAFNPFSYLRSGVDYENCSGSGQCSEGDPFNPSGSWNWPVNPKIKFTQGYGRTWAVANTWVGRVYQSHNGIDIDSLSSTDVKAVRAGKLFRGSFSGSGGCKLRYVRVDHDENELDTYYLHINY
jgi:peptidoglycan hydrolase CwlO-like protein